jgi:hypothetical protein
MGAPLAQCLPAGIALSDPVDPQTTVGQRLVDLQARCDHGTLVDASGTAIRFYRVVGCWGNPPADYLEILERQRRELQALRTQSIVVEISCASGRDLRRIP